MSLYRLTYWVHCSDLFDIEANSEEEAREKLRSKVERGGVDIEDLDIGDDGIELVCKLN